jgi:hypothetical protein
VLPGQSEKRASSKKQQQQLVKRTCAWKSPLARRIGAGIIESGLTALSESDSDSPYRDPPGEQSEPYHACFSASNTIYIAY